MFWLSSEEEYDIQLASCCDVVELTSAVGQERNDWRLSIRIPEEESHELVLSLGLYEAEWMHAVTLLAPTAIVNLWLLPRRPHCVSTFTQQEIPCSFSESKDPLGWQYHS